jgi:hypothetical protein
MYIKTSINIIVASSGAWRRVFRTSLVACFLVSGFWFLAWLISNLEDGFKYELKMEMIRFSETSDYILTSRRYIPEYDNVHNYSCENSKSYLYTSQIHTHVRMENYSVTSS